MRITKLLGILTGLFCIVAAALKSRGGYEVEQASQAAGYLACFGTVIVACSGLMGGFTGRFGTWGHVDSAAPEWILVILGWIMIGISLAVTVWLMLQG